jgi:hypothetical protein
MGDLQEAVEPMAEALRSGEPLEVADRATIAMWLESLANGLERLDTLVHALEAKIVTREHLDELVSC